MLVMPGSSIMRIDDSFSSDLFNSFINSPLLNLQIWACYKGQS